MHFSNNFFTDFCDSCCLGKSHKLHAPLSKTKYNNLFDLIYTGIWGPTSTTLSNDYNYYIAFMDAYSSYTWIYFLKNKSDALSAFTLFQKYAKTQFQSKIKSVQSDFGGDFIPFTKLLNAHDMLHRLTCPHTSHQSEKVDTKHRHI